MSNVFISQAEPSAIACRSPSISLELGSSLDESQLLRDKIARLQQEREHLSTQVKELENSTWYLHSKL